MFSYYESGIKKTTAGTAITFSILQCLIKANPNKDAIEHLRALEYGSIEYKKFKQENPFPALKPHGTFKNINRKEILQQLSGYLYFDIDACDIQAPIDVYKQQVLKQFPEHISMLGKSIGGKGLFFLVKVKGLTEQNFVAVHQYFREDIFKQLPLDTNATGLARNWFISSDEDLYINNTTELDVKDINFNTEIINNEKCYIQGCTKIKETKEKHNDLECSTFIPTPIESFWDSILFKSSYSIIDDVADVVERPFYQLKLRKIKDGYKHRVFPIMIWTMIKLNPHLSFNQIASFMLWFNKNYTNHTPMLPNKLIAMVVNCYKNYDEDKVPFKMKALWLNPKLQMGRKAKVRLCIGINAEIRKAKSMEQIKQAIREMIAEGLKINKAQVANRCGLNRNCVSTHWNECIAAFPALQGQQIVPEHDCIMKVVKGKDEAPANVYKMTRHEYVQKFNDPFKTQGQLYQEYQKYLKVK